MDADLNDKNEAQEVGRLLGFVDYRGQCHISSPAGKVSHQFRQVLLAFTNRYRLLQSFTCLIDTD